MLGVLEQQQLQLQVDVIAENLHMLGAKRPFMTGWAHAVCEAPPEQHTAACFDAGGARFERVVLCVCRAVDGGALSAQAVAYLELQGAVLDLAAQEIDTKATRGAGRAR